MSGITDVNFAEVPVVVQVVGLGGRCIGHSRYFLCGSYAYVLTLLCRIVSAMFTY